MTEKPTIAEKVSAEQQGNNTMPYVSENTRNKNPFSLHETLNEAIECALEWVEQECDPFYWREGDKIIQNTKKMPDFSCKVYKNVPEAIASQYDQDPDALAYLLHAMADAIQKFEKNA